MSYVFLYDTSNLDPHTLHTIPPSFTTVRPNSYPPPGRARADNPLSVPPWPPPTANDHPSGQPPSPPAPDLSKPHRFGPLRYAICNQTAHPLHSRCASRYATLQVQHRTSLRCPAPFRRRHQLQDTSRPIRLDIGFGKANLHHNRFAVSHPTHTHLLFYTSRKPHSRIRAPPTESANLPQLPMQQAPETPHASPLPYARNPPRRRCVGHATRRQPRPYCRAHPPPRACLLHYSPGSLPLRPLPPIGRS